MIVEARALALRPLARWLVVVLLLWCGAVVTAGPAVAQGGGSVTAQLDRPQVSIDETVTLTVTATDLEGELDSSSLEREFDVVGRSRSTQVDVLNGVRRDRASWVLELAPRRLGLLTVPPVAVAGVLSSPLTLEVVAPAAGSSRDLFVEAEIDERSPWVQSQALLTVRVFQAVDFIDAGLSEPRGDGMRIERLGDDRRGRATRDGREYEVTERRYAVFAQRSGSLTIEPVALDATLPLDPNRVRGFFTPSRRVVRRSEAIELDVRAQPANSSGWWLPARALSIDGTLRAAGEATTAEESDRTIEAQIGVPLNRIFSIRALGVTGSQLPALEPPDIDGAAVYAEPATLSSSVEERGVVSEQRHSWAIVPQRSGWLELPPVTVDWFDAIAGVPRTAELPAERVWVADDSSSVAAAPPADAIAVAPVGDVASDTGIASVPVSGPVGSRWPMWLSLAALAGWALTALAWGLRERRLRRRTVATASTADRSDPSIGAALAEVERLEQGEQPLELARAALSWAQARWPDRPVRSLREAAARLDDAAAADSLLALDRHVYGAMPSSRSYAGLAAQLAGSNESARSSAARRESLPTL